jgi:hypothetical protein
MQEGDSRGPLLKLLMPVMPLYLFKINGKVDVEINPEHAKALFG